MTVWFFKDKLACVRGLPPVPWEIPVDRGRLVRLARSWASRYSPISDFQSGREDFRFWSS